MNSTPLVSVIIPVYNTAKYLQKCLDSVLAQTYGNIEVLCFNDASTDDSLQVLEAYDLRDDRIRVVNSLTNVKQGGGRNRCLRESRGEYVAFVDSDDWIDEQYVERLFMALQNAKAEVAICDYYVAAGDEAAEVSLLGKNLAAVSQHEIKRRILTSGTPIWSALYRKNLISDNDLYFPEGVIYEDNAVAAAIFLTAAVIAKVDAPLYYYRTDNVSTVRTKNNPKFFDRLTTTEMFRSHLKRLGHYAEFREEIDEAFLNLYYRNTIFGLFEHFSPIPYRRIAEVQRTVTEEYGNEAIREYIAKQRLTGRGVLAVSLLSPRLGHTVYRLFTMLSRLRHL